MFDFLKKKKVDTLNITDFNEAINAINIFMLLSEWGKAKKSLEEVKTKEQNSYEKLIDNLDKQDKEFAEKEKRMQLEIYKKKIEKLKILEGKLEINEQKYYKKQEHDKFELRFKKIKTELDALLGKGRNEQAINLLQNFLEENKDNDSVISFFNKEKKIIVKNIENVKKIELEKVKKNARLEALKLIWWNINLEEEEVEKAWDKKIWFFTRIIKKVNFYKKLKEQIKRKQLLDEINLLIEEDSKVKNDMAAKKLANIHRWLIKEINNDNMIGYELYGKILWADKISWDTFGFNEDKRTYNFFLWDATGHGIRAWFIITLLSRFFNKYVGKWNLQDLTFEINNGLKQDLKSRNFITWIFFEIIKEDSDTISFVWMGHEPILIFRHKEKKIEKIIPWGLAAGIRLIKNKEDIRIKQITLEDNDVLLVYSDGIIENKSPEWIYYGIERLQQNFLEAALEEGNISKLYEKIIDTVKEFRGGSNFDDDASALIVKRNINKDVVDEDSEYLQELSNKEWLKRSQIKKLEWKNKEQIEKELAVIRKEKETERIVKILESLYYTWEILKLKQEAIRYIKDGYIHKKINFFLRKAIDNEKQYKIEQKEQKIKNKYTVLKELLKKWDYKTVIQEIEEIISKDGNV